MIKGIESITLSSENAEKLADFYKDEIGLARTIEAEIGNNGESLFGFEIEGSPTLYIMDSAEIKGQQEDPRRIVFSLEVDDIEEEVEKLDKNRVKKVADTFHMQNYGYIAIFEDPDGNYFQLVQIKPT